jgi:hypothetical protein
MTFHNLAFMNNYTRTLKATGEPPVPAVALESKVFDTWLQEVCCSSYGRRKQLSRWEEAAGSIDAFPLKQRPPEGDDYHLMPLLVCSGAAGADTGRVWFDGDLMGCKLTSFVFGEGPALG